MSEHEMDHEHHRRPARWFMRGFATAALLFAAFLYFGGYFATTGARDLATPQHIIVGK